MRTKNEKDMSKNMILTRLHHFKNLYKSSEFKQNSENGKRHSLAEKQE